MMTFGLGETKKMKQSRNYNTRQFAVHYSWLCFGLDDRGFEVRFSEGVSFCLRGSPNCLNSTGYGLRRPKPQVDHCPPIAAGQ